MNDFEPIYDEQIAPLMKQIIDICHEHGIPMIASFKLTDNDDPLYATTALHMDELFTSVIRVIRGSHTAVGNSQLAIMQMALYAAQKSGERDKSSHSGVEQPGE